jgi:2-polyprenyl-3-methyl-5-hydroxy-6-metoxy-1,4-benzoquinol methylase
MISTQHRSEAAEIMDDFALTGDVLQNALDKIAQINKLLGGNQVTLQGVQELIQGLEKSKKITIVDFGCGNGDMLRGLADFAAKNNFDFDLIGIDANSFTIEYAKKLSDYYPNIKYLCVDIFNESSIQLKYDIALCTLTLHHFKNIEIVKILEYFYKKATIGIVINDLHRSKLAYYLFKIVCFVFQLNQMSKQDGLVSILRGFKKQELINFSKKLNFEKSKVQWKWAFRYQWIIQKT